MERLTARTICGEPYYIECKENFTNGRYGCPGDMCLTCDTSVKHCQRMCELEEMVEQSSDTDRAKKIARIADYFGCLPQLIKTTEELGELASETSRLANNIMFKTRLDDTSPPLSYDGISEEIADVYIMLDQLVYLLDLDAAVENTIDQKIQRTLCRIEDQVQRERIKKMERMKKNN